MKDTPRLNSRLKIRRRAYKLYEERGKADGHALEDWLQAKADLVRPRAA